MKFLVSPQVLSSEASVGLLAHTGNRGLPLPLHPTLLRPATGVPPSAPRGDGKRHRRSPRRAVDTQDTVRSRHSRARAQTHRIRLIQTACGRTVFVTSTPDTLGRSPECHDAFSYYSFASRQTRPHPRGDGRGLTAVGSLTPEGPRLPRPRQVWASGLNPQNPKGRDSLRSVSVLNLKPSPS